MQRKTSLRVHRALANRRYESVLFTEVLEHTVVLLQSRNETLVLLVFKSELISRFLQDVSKHRVVRVTDAREDVVNHVNVDSTHQPATESALAREVSRSF